MVSIAEQFGANLKRFRRRVRLSQEELAQAAGLHRTAIGKLENGERVPRIDTVIKLCGALEAEPAELLAGIVWQPLRYPGTGRYAVDHG
jgi:transcriptional regulator with XRE-family HTH domain